MVVVHVVVIAVVRLLVGSATAAVVVWSSFGHCARFCARRCCRCQVVGRFGGGGGRRLVVVWSLCLSFGCCVRCHRCCCQVVGRFGGGGRRLVVIWSSCPSSSLSSSGHWLVWRRRWSLFGCRLVIVLVVVLVVVVVVRSLVGSAAAAVIVWSSFGCRCCCRQVVWTRHGIQILPSFPFGAHRAFSQGGTSHLTWSPCI